MKFEGTMARKNIYREDCYLVVEVLVFLVIHIDFSFLDVLVLT